MTFEISRASAHDAGAILSIQKSAFASEAKRYDDWSIATLTESVDEFHASLAAAVVLKATINDRVIGSIRGVVKSGECAIGRLSVDPEFQGQGFGKRLLEAIEAAFPEVQKFTLFTGAKSDANLGMYLAFGYRVVRVEEPNHAQRRADGSVRKIYFAFLEKGR